MSSAVSLSSNDAPTDWVARLALWRAPGVGPVIFERIATALEDLNQLATPSGLTRAKPLMPNKAYAFLTDKPLADLAARDLRWLDKNHRYVLFKGQSHYPQLLAPLAEAPPVLFVSGSLSVLQSPQIAMVGTRNPTTVGRQMASEFAQALINANITVTSGLALGIDGAAHLGALAAGGPTVAVLANGLDQVYPKRHQALAKRIVMEGGAVVSEFPAGLAPRKEHFPRRNRIISGMTYGVLVVEAAVKSGSLITARLAGQQGREVFAIPGHIQNPMSRGCHQLLREGACLVETIQDMTQVIYPLLERDLQQIRQDANSAVGDATPELSPQERLLLEAIDYQVTTLDEMMNQLGWSASELLTHLMTLELKECVVTVAGGYQKVRGVA